MSKRVRPVEGEDMPSGNPPESTNEKSNFGKIVLIVVGVVVLALAAIIIFG